MTGFSIGTSILTAGRRGLDLTGQNMANAATPGYHRQSLNLANRTTTDGKTSLGVDVVSITRYTAPPLRAAIMQGNASAGSATVLLGVQRQVEASFGTSPGTIADSLESFFNQVEQLTSRPADPALRRTLLGSATDLAARFNGVAADLDNLSEDVRNQATRAVSEVNDFAVRIADLNHKIAEAEGSGGQANDLKDQRDRMIDQLSQRMDIRTVDQPLGQVNVIANGAAVIVGETPNKFQIVPDVNGKLVFSEAGSSQPIKITTGSIGGFIQAYNQEVPATRARLDGLARELAARVNGVQATGLGTAGPFTALAGLTPVPNPAAPLATQNLPIPVQAGQLTVSVTDVGTGNRTNTTIAIDPATQSLNDIATALAGIPGLSAAVNPASNTLEITAQGGFTFDFAGRDTNPPGGGAVAEPDTANVLSALGVNGFFAGTNAASLAVRPEMLANPGLFAAARSPQVGDGTNLERMAGIRDQVAIGGKTLGGEFADLTATVGASVNSLSAVQDAHAAILQNLNAQEQAVTGVDMNEELVHLLDYQRMVEAGTRFLSVINGTLDAIFDMVR